MATTVLVPMGVKEGLVVALFHRGPKPDEMKLVATIDGHDQTIPVTTWRNCHAPFKGMDGAEFELWAAKVEVKVPPATRVALELAGAEAVVGSAWVPPGPDTRRCTLAFGSCFGLRDVRGLDNADFDIEIEGNLSKAYRQLIAGSSDPVYHLWLGDQVYLDDPFVGLRGRINIHRRILERYADTWGLGRRSGFAHLLSRSTNWFLADDHEFWNGYPRANVTMVRATAGRLLEQSRRWFRDSDEPSHPYHQGPWGRMAGAAFMTFQCPGFDTHLNQFSEEHSPAGLVTFGSDTFTVALLDTRWNRTMLRASYRNRHAGFSAPSAMEQLEALLQQSENLVVLCLSRPIVNRRPQRWVMPIFSETAPEHYRDQYRELLAAIEARAALGRPTVVLGGDVHEHSARLGLGGRVLEIVSSPMSLIESLDGRQGRARSLRARAIQVGAGVLNGIQRAISFPQRSWVADGISDVVTLASEDAARDGLAAVRIDTSEPERPVVTYTCHLFGLAEPQTVTLQWQRGAWVASAVLAAADAA